HNCYLLGISSRILEVTGFCVVAFKLGWIKVLRGVLESKIQVSQLNLHFVDRLLTEVTDIQQVRFGALSELTNGVDFLTLQAVVRPNGEVQILNRHAVSSDVLGLLWGWSDLDAFSSGVELASKAEELDQGAAGGCQCIASRD